MPWLRLFVWVAIGIATITYFEHDAAGPSALHRRDVYLRQLEDDDGVAIAITQDYAQRRALQVGCGAAWLFFGILLFGPEIGRVLRNR